VVDADVTVESFEVEIDGADVKVKGSTRCRGITEASNEGVGMVATRAEWRVESDNNDDDTSVPVTRSVESSDVETDEDLVTGAGGVDADNRDPDISGIMLVNAASSLATLSNNSAFSCSKRAVLSSPLATAPVVLCRNTAFSASSSATLL